MSVFADYAPKLLDAGYSPIPIRAGEKRPLLDKWDHLREVALKPKDIRTLDRSWPNLGLGVCGGFGGLVPIDVDSDDPAVRSAIRGALPTPTVVKRGRKGATAFYFDPEGCIQGRKFHPKVDGVKQPPLVEILTTGQTVLPPTIHPELGQPYHYRTALQLWDQPAEDLPHIEPEHIEALERALAPWVPLPKVYAPLPVDPDAEPVCEKRMKACARAALDKHVSHISGLPEGRNEALFRAICEVGKFVHRGVLSAGEVENGLVGAMVASGYTEKHSLKAARATYQSGLKRSANDPLPMLAER